MNYTRGPWSIQIKPKSFGGGVGHLRYLSIDNDTGPVVIVDKFDQLIATVVHRPGRGEGFAETASNARLIGHAPDIFEKSAELVRALKAGEDHDEPLKRLDELLQVITGVVVST